MNNDDLAERLRLPSFSKRDRLAGADRIDELVATCEELEARLEKAVVTLAWCARHEESEHARATLAELKGKDT